MSAPDGLDVQYSCAECGLRNVMVLIPYRESNRDVCNWMEDEVIVRLGKDHAERSPHCHPVALKEIKIPITGSDWIGGPKVH